MQPKEVKAIDINTSKEIVAKRKDDFTEHLINMGYTKGIFDERNRIIKILEKHWLRGLVARRIIDEIIAEIKTDKNLVRY